MSAARRSNPKRTLPPKNAAIAALDSDNAGTSSISQLWSAEMTSIEPDIRQEDDPASYASVKKGIPKQFSASTAAGHDKLAPLFETRVNDTTPESGDVASLSEQSIESQRLEIHRLRLEVAALTAQKQRLSLLEIVQTEEMKYLKRKSEVDALESKGLLAELEKTRATQTRLKEHLQCQICLELLKSPWTLSPCGHAGCFECLMSWFLAQDSEEEDEDPDAVIHKDKTCPQCRALIVLAPTPSYILKNLVNEMHPTTPSASTSVGDDPWARIFGPIGEDHDSSEEGTDGGDDDDDDEGSDEESDGDTVSSGPLSDSSEYRNEYQARRDHLDQVMAWETEMRNQASAWVEPTWQPPRFDSGTLEISTEDLTRLSPLSRPQIMSLLRRGASKSMMELFHLSYEYRRGILFYPTVADTACVRLGWNISRSSDDPDGHFYMRSVIDEMRAHPGRFSLEVGSRNGSAVVRLVPSAHQPEDTGPEES